MMNRSFHNHLSLLALSFGLALALCGCASVNVKSLEDKEDLKNAAEKNYVLNAENTVNVGEPIIVRKSYWYREVELNQARALNDFEAQVSVLLLGGASRKAKEGDLFPVVGTMTLNSNACRIVKIGASTMGENPMGLLVKADTGDVVGAVGKNKLGWFTGSLIITPKNTMFTLLKNIVVKKDRQFEYFEILFTGRIGQNATFLYREFSPSDLARPSFFQNLTYNLEKEDLIQFRKLQIKVLSISNQSVRFKVLSD